MQSKTIDLGLEVNDLKDNLKALFLQLTGLEVVSVQHKIESRDLTTIVELIPMVHEVTSNLFGVIDFGDAITNYYLSRHQLKAFLHYLSLNKTIGTKFLGEGDIYYFLLTDIDPGLLVKVDNLWFISNTVDEVDDFIIDTRSRADVMKEEGYEVIRSNLELSTTDDLIITNSLLLNDLSLYLVRRIKE